MALYRSGYCVNMITLDIGFIRFYHQIIIEDLQWNNLESNLRFLDKVKDCYCKYSLQNSLSNISFENAGMRAAYVFSNTPCFSSAVAYQFINFLHKNPLLLKHAIHRDSLRICCLGGGPGTEAIAIVKALELILKVFCPTTKPLKIYATIVDIDPGWAETLKKVTQNWWKWVDTKVVKLKVSFKRADLTQPLSDDVVEIVKNSDIVTMVKFVSAVYGTQGREKISKMLQDIIQHIREDGVLFFMNCSRFSSINDLSDAIAKSVNMDLIYGPLYYRDDHLSRPSLDLCYNLYSRHYGNWPPTIQCQNHIAAWRKNSKQKDAPICNSPNNSTP